MRKREPEAAALGRLDAPPLRSGSMRFALPIGVGLHLAVGLALTLEAARFRSAQLPPFAPLAIRLAPPPAEGLRSGDPASLATDDGAERSAARRAPDRSALLAMLDRIPPPEPAPFGFENGLPEGSLTGFPDGLPEGVLGGLPGGVPGGIIGAPGGAADPTVPPPDRPPVPLLTPRPRFPEEAVRNGVRGRVVLRALITERGTVEVLRVLRSVPELDQAATRLVEAEWRFRPAERNGRPVAALSDLVIRFNLR